MSGGVRTSLGRRFTAVYSAVLLTFSGYVIADTFLIERVYAVAESSDATEAADGNADAHASTGSTAEPDESDAEAVVTDSSYTAEGIQITITEYRENDTTIYVADVQVESTDALLAAFAQESYGRNVTEPTSEIAEAAGAILAINGDYYGAQNTGYVLRNGVTYRDTGTAGQEALVIDAEGNLQIVDEGDVTLSELAEAGAQQVFSFGPGLISDGVVTVTDSDEVDRAMSSNPRTAIGQIGEGHYVFVVADGRTSESEGLTLEELAEFMESLGVVTAYNLDGGGSSTMYFNGQVINNPTTNGRSTRERSVSDIVYIGS